MDACGTHDARPLSKPTRNEEHEEIKLIERGFFNTLAQSVHSQCWPIPNIDDAHYLIYYLPHFVLTTYTGFWSLERVKQFWTSPT